MNNILPLFSTPVYTFDKYKDDENNFIELAKSQELIINKAGNFVSSNNNVLDLPEFFVLKERIEESVLDYTNVVLRLEQYDFYITQSWLNINPHGTGHHIHHHSNSLFSGVYYIKSTGSCIKFHANKDFHMSGNILAIDPYDYNLWNSNTWSLPVENNTVVLFPSTTTHSVDNNQTEEDRISLAFNVFVRGKIGLNKTLNELFL